MEKIIVISDGSYIKCPWASAEMWKLRKVKCSSLVKKRPLSFCHSDLSCSAVQYLAPPLPSLLVLPSSAVLYSQLVCKKKKKKITSFMSWVTTDQADRSAASSVSPQCGSEGFTCRRTASSSLFRLQTVAWKIGKGERVGLPCAVSFHFSEQVHNWAMSTLKERDKDLTLSTSQ